MQFHRPLLPSFFCLNKRGGLQTLWMENNGKKLFANEIDGKRANNKNIREIGDILPVSSTRFYNPTNE